MPDVTGIISDVIMVIWSAPHPRCVAAGTCQCFLLRDGSFTLMKIASLMFLAILLTTYFQFQGSLYEQISGAAMGVPHQPHSG